MINEKRELKGYIKESFWKDLSNEKYSKKTYSNFT